MGDLAVLIMLLSGITHAQFSTPAGSVTQVVALIGSRVNLPCKVPKLEQQDRVRLVLWYREDIGTPIYSADARDANFSIAHHWSADSLFGRRAIFKVNNVSSSLIVSGVRKEDEGFFRCRLDFLYAQTRNSLVHLEVTVPPRKVWITDSKEEVLSSALEGLSEGSTLNITCHSEGGDPRPRLSWMQDNRPVVSGKQIVSENGRALNLHLSSLDRSDSGTHLSCQASNSNLAQPLSATVKIGLLLRALEVTIDDTPNHLSAGAESTLICRAFGARPAPLFTWRRDNQIVKQELGLETSNHNETVSELRFVPHLEDRGKLIKCSVIQRNETVLDPVDQISLKHQLETTRLLLVHYKPIVSLVLGASLRVEEIKEGDDIYFDCLVDSEPPPGKIEWFHDESRLTQNVSLGRIISNHSLVLQKVDRNTSGDYKCSATNKEGEEKSSSLTLTIQFAPVCKSDSPRVYGVARYEQVKITCAVQANPGDVVFFRWAFNGTTNGKLIEFPVTNFSSVNGISTLKYVPTSDVEFGTILCWGKNGVGTQDTPCMFHVVAAEKPDPVRNCISTPQSTDSLYLQCVEGFSGGLDQSFMLEVLSADGIVLKDSISSTKPTFSVRGLSPDSMFLMAVTAVNAKGRSESVTTKVFTLRPPETQKNTEANSKTSQNGDFWSDNSPLIGAVTGAVLCLILMAAPILVAFLRKSRARRHSYHSPELDTISGATAVQMGKEDKPDVVPRKGLPKQGFLGQPPMPSMQTTPLAAIVSSDIYRSPFCTPTREMRHQKGALLSENPWATNFSSSLPRKKSVYQEEQQVTKSYLNIFLLTENECQKHESQV